MNTFKKNAFIAGLCLLCFTACSSRYPAGVENALRLAGENRVELEKVLEYYSQNESDSLKYEAACFLIEHMIYYHSYEGKILDDYLQIYEEIATSGKEPQQILDSFVLKFGDFSKRLLKKKPDIQAIRSDYLIHNIEWAFKVWEEQPWGENVSFEAFCEYILPYRIEDEKISEWREKMYQSYNHLFDPYRESGEIRDPLFAAQIVFDSLCLAEKYFTTLLPDMPHTGPDLCEQWRSGTCRELTDLTVYVMRALGIPCGIDFFPLHARVSSGHLWAFILNRDGDTYTSDYLDPAIGILSSKDVQHLTAKIYRRTFSLNKRLVKELPSSCPAFFHNPRFKDVTHHYTNRNSVRMIILPKAAIYPDIKIPPVVYLCASFRQSWEPVAWTKTNGKQIQFKNVKSDIMFRVGIWNDTRMDFITDVINIRGLNGPVKVILPDEGKKENAVLLSKCEVESDEEFSQFMIGGVFEGSNHDRFLVSDTLFQIQSRPARLENVVHLDSTKKYRYMRYVGPENSHCDVAEILFYGHANDTTPVAGRIMGTPNHTSNDRNEYTNALDGNPYTSFHYKEANGGWVGLDARKPLSLSRIVYVPRNRDNFIRRGDLYELFYFDKSWHSLGRKIANADSLPYSVPCRALLYLKNHTRGKQERIFTYENGKQVWW
jgi:hypothetical protein